MFHVNSRKIRMMDVDIHQAARTKKRKALTSSKGKWSNQPARSLVISQAVRKEVLQQGETKYSDILIAAVNIAANAGGLAPNAVSAAGGVFNPPQGNTQITRIGNQVTLMALRGHIQLQLPATATVAGGQPNTSIRLIIARDKDPGAAVPQLLDIIGPDQANAQANMLPFMATTTMGRWQILYDQYTVLQDPNVMTTGTNSLVKYIKFKKKFPQGLKVRFNSTAALSNTDQFHVFVYCQVATTVPTFTGVFRGAFKDE